MLGFADGFELLMCEKHCILGSFQSPVKKIHRHTWVGFEPMTFAILEQMSYQLDSGLVVSVV